MFWSETKSMREGRALSCGRRPSMHLGRQDVGGMALEVVGWEAAKCCSAQLAGARSSQAEAIPVHLLLAHRPRETIPARSRFCPTVDPSSTCQIRISNQRELDVCLFLLAAASKLHALGSCSIVKDISSTTIPFSRTQSLTRIICVQSVSTAMGTVGCQGGCA